MQVIAHGVDLVDVARIEAMLAEHGPRFVERCFTERERRYADASRRHRAQRYAARFACKEAVLKAGVYATRDRRVRKRTFRSLWVTRINAAARQHGTSYNRLVYGMAEAGIVLNRKVLAEIAISDPAAFEEVVKLATAAADKKSERA